MNAQEKIRGFVVQNFYVAEGDRLSDDASLIRTGVVDSTGVLEIIAFLEQEFGVLITDVETTPDNLDTIARIASFISRKQAEKS